MRSKLRQAGFTALEAVVALVILAALVGAGLWVMNRNSDSTTDTSQTADVQENTEAPAVDNTDDLDAAETTLDQSNLDAGSADNENLDQELNNF